MSHMGKNGKSSKNSSILVLIFWGSIPCDLCACACVCVCIIYTLLQVISHYGLSVLAVSVMG